LWKEDTPLKLIDDYIKESCIESEVLRCIQIGLLCLQHDPDDRPSMTSVILMLSSESTLSYNLKEPSFLIKRLTAEGEPSSQQISNY
jgi:hypothetical protein